MERYFCNNFLCCFQVPEEGMDLALGELVRFERLLSFGFLALVAPDQFQKIWPSLKPEITQYSRLISAPKQLSQLIT